MFAFSFFIFVLAKALTVLLFIVLHYKICGLVCLKLKFVPFIFL